MRIRLIGGFQRPFRRLENIGVEFFRSRHAVDKALRQFTRRKFFGAQAVARLRKRQRRQISVLPIYSTTFGTAK